MNKKDFITSAFELSNGTTFSVVHNVPDNDGGINTITAAFYCWLLRTTVYTDKSFINYINSKGIYKAYSVDDFKKMKG